MNNENIQFTKDWWKRLCSDPEKMRAWLIKLEQTELDGYYDWEYYKTQFAKDIGPKTLLTVTNIGLDELKHSNLLRGIMKERGIEPVKGYGNQSSYWNEMNAQVMDFDTCCAINYHGEALAAFRFEVISEMEETPSDIKEILYIILPDEQFHREALKRLATEETLERIGIIHANAVRALKRQ